MPNPVGHFEIYGDNPEKLAGFYEKLFGWQIKAVPQMEYWTINTVQTDARGTPTEPGGINGGLMKRPMPTPSSSEATSRRARPRRIG